MSNPPQDPNKPSDEPRYGENPATPPPSPPGQGPAPEQQPWQPPAQPPRPQYGEHAPGQQHGQPNGQPGYGAQPPAQTPPRSPYSYQSAQPGAYGYPSGQGQFGGQGQFHGQGQFQGQQGSIVPPKEILISFWLLIAAAVLTAVDTIIGLATLGSAANMEQFETMMGQQGTEVPMDPEALVGFVAVVTVVVVLIGIALYLLIAFMIKKGKNWARITATVLAALSLFTLIFAQPSLQWVVVVLGVVAVVLLYTPSASNFFNAHKARKQGAFGR